MTDYKIGEVARLLGLTTQALRFYEQEGVVTPKKSENGTRYYDEDQLILLNFHGPTGRQLHHVARIGGRCILRKNRQSAYQ